MKKVAMLTLFLSSLICFAGYADPTPQEEPPTPPSQTCGAATICKDGTTLRCWGASPNCFVRATSCAWHPAVGYYLSALGYVKCNGERTEGNDTADLCP